MNHCPAPLSVTRRIALLGGAAIALAGCGSITSLVGPPPPRQIFVLKPQFSPLPDAPHVEWALNVSIPLAPESLDTERIALINAPNRMDYFANAQWNDRVPLLLQSLLVDAFERSGDIAAVGIGSQGINGAYVLETELGDFEAYYAVPDTPPKITVKINAKLIGVMRHEVVDTLRSEHEVQAAANDIGSITVAFDQATKAAVEEIVLWTLKSPPPGKLAAP